MSVVLPLQNLCLVAIRDSLKDRPNPYLRQVPPSNLRQNLWKDILDLVLASKVITHESAYTSLSSPEYLDGLSKFSTRRGVTSDREFLDRVADSLSVVRNGKKIGEGITELSLNIYTWLSVDVHIPLTLDSVVRVISQCPNLKSLHLSVVQDKLGLERRKDMNLLAGLPSVFDKSSSDCGILNQIPALAPCLSVLENVEKFSLSTEGGRGPCLARERPVLNFRCLSSLRLAHMSVDAKAWNQFLMNVRNSMIEFEVYEVEIRTMEDDDDDMKLVMPFPLPNLRSFKMEGSGPCTLQLIENLMECPKLEKIEMPIKTDEEEDAMLLLSQMNESVSVQLGMDLRVEHNRDQYFDMDSNFKWVNLFREKIKKVHFAISVWDAEHSTALKNMFATCPDLVEMSFHIDMTSSNNIVISESISSDLAPFLRDPSFVSKFRKLALQGPFDRAVLDALFKNAANLESFKMRNCPQLSDSHLQLWASCGGKPKRLELENCINITDHGLIPIFIGSGQRMTYFRLRDSRLVRISKFTWRTLFDHCPFFHCNLGLSKLLMRLFGSECPEYLRR